ncbi:MAG: hypothetical protein JNJ80_06115 [Gemmatimonadetes bacterium]|nr:hypothetical protein [Gemmatimonadota bacterium]
MEALVAGFRACQLPKAAWTHQAHLATGLWFLDRLGLAEARRLLPEAIRQFNLSVGGTNTATAGYHETITQFYLTVIEDFRRGLPAGSPLVDRVNAVVATLGDRRLPTRHFSEALLWSETARARWVEPDLLPLPAVEPGPTG